ncbi:MAG: hypothetical protein ACJ74U_12820 [Jatrophihabitantaceae bacterium]
MSRILTILTGCALIAGLLVGLPVTPASGTPCWPTPGCSYGPGSFSAVTPGTERVFDTRTGLGGRLGAVAPGHTVTAHVWGAGTPAAVIEVTVPDAPAGSLSVYPSGTAWSGRVTMTLVSGGPIQQQLTVALGADGGVTIRNNSTRAVQLIVDVLGYYNAGTPTAYGTFAALDSRILDTRATSPLPTNHKITLSLPGLGGIPAGGASAVVLNIAVLSARANGLLSVTDRYGSQATVHMRFVGTPATPQTMQTERMVTVGSDGTLTFSQSSAASVQLVIDLMGYFLPGADGVPDVDGHYVPIGAQPIKNLLAPYGEQLQLYQHQPLIVNPGFFGYWTLAYNVILTNDRPGQPAQLGAYAPDYPWHRTVTVSTTPAGQTTERVIGAGSEQVLTLVNLTSAQSTYLHGYVTGYYWYFYCTHNC